MQLRERSESQGLTTRTPDWSIIKKKHLFETNEFLCVQHIPPLDRNGYLNIMNKHPSLKYLRMTHSPGACIPALPALPMYLKSNFIITPSVKMGCIFLHNLPLFSHPPDTAGPRWNLCHMPLDLLKSGARISWGNIKEWTRDCIISFSLNCVFSAIWWWGDNTHRHLAHRC